jgi:PAS domain S-box-containing protein
VIALTDIEGRGQAKAALRESDERYRSLLNAIDVGFCVIEVKFDETDRAVDYRLVEVNPAFERQTGLKDVAGKWMRELVPGHEQHWFDTYGRIALTGVPARFESAAAGLDRWYDVHAFRIGEPGKYRVGVLFNDVSKRKHAEAAVNESEARFRLIADSAPVPMWVTRLDRKREFINRAYLDFVGLPYGEAIDFDWRQIIHPDDIARIYAEQVEKEASLRPFTLEARYRDAADEWRWLRSESQPRWDPKGGHIGFIGIAYDVTPAKQAAIDLKAHNETLEARVEERTRERDRLWELSEDLLVVADYDGHLLRISPSWMRLLGHDRKALLTRPYNELVHPDDLGTAIDAVLGMRSSGRPVSFEDRVLAADGTWRWIAWTLSPEAGGERLTGVGRDVTRAKEAAEARLASEARLRTIFETSYQYQGLLALDGMVLEANTTSLEGIKARLEDVVGRPFWDTPWFAQTPGMPDAVRAAVSAVASGETIRREILLYLPTGWRSFDFTMRPMRDENGEVVAIVPEAVEITERRQAEEALRQSQKLEAMGQLTGGVAHDFNNLLTPIIGGLDMLHRRGVGGEREQRLINGALQSAERAKTLVQRLLAFARRQPLQPIAVDLAGLVIGMATLVASTSGPQIKVVVDAPSDLPPANADPNQLEMAILNLSVNARDAMPDGGTLRISAANETIGSDHRSKLTPGPYVRLSVADTGTGMDEATLARAVEPFFSTKGVGKGTGLGLSMVHGLASQLGGALALTSKPGLGTNVELWLPVSVKPGQIAERSGQPTPESRGVGTALLVEDEDVVRMSTADMLAELGYKIAEASSAEEALSLLTRGLRVDVLVTDHLMPGMTGVDLARVVRDRSPETPVLIISGFAETEGIAPDLPRLTKPFRQADLAAALAKAIAESRPQGPILPTNVGRAN